VRTARERWSLTLGPQFSEGYVACVFPAEGPEGEPVVLKVSFISDETRTESDALRLWDGHGAVQVLDTAPDLGALLLERLEPGTPLEDHPDPDGAITIGCRLLRRLERPLRRAHPFPLVVHLARRLAAEFPERFERLGRPFDQGLVDEAVKTCLELAAWTGRPVLANRDFHFGNVLAAQREPWLAIDPKPLVGEPAFDTGHLLRNLLRGGDLDRPAVDSTVERLATELGLDRNRVRAWAFVRSVDDAISWLEEGGTDPSWDVDCAPLLAPT